MRNLGCRAFCSQNKSLRSSWGKTKKASKSSVLWSLKRNGSCENISVFLQITTKMYSDLFCRKKECVHVRKKFHFQSLAGNELRIYFVELEKSYYWWLVRATYVVDGRFLGHFFWKVEGGSAHTRESRVTHVHSN